MKPPRNTREVQWFIPHGAQAFPLLLRGASTAILQDALGVEPFNWSEECQRAFEEVKRYLTKLSSLVSSRHGAKLLLLYLTASAGVVSAVRIIDSEAGQRLVYYVSKASQGTRTRYTELEKLVYALLMASRKLRHYFLVHTITIPTSYLLALLLRNRGASGQIGK